MTAAAHASNPPARVFALMRSAVTTSRGDENDSIGKARAGWARPCLVDGRPVGRLGVALARNGRRAEFRLPERTLAGRVHGLPRPRPRPARPGTGDAAALRVG